MAVKAEEHENKMRLERNDIRLVAILLLSLYLIKGTKYYERKLFKALMVLLRRMPHHSGRPTSSGNGTALSAPKLLLIAQPCPAVFILQPTQQHLILPSLAPIQVLTKHTIA